MKLWHFITATIVALAVFSYFVSTDSSYSPRLFDIGAAFTSGTCSIDAVLTSAETTVFIHADSDKSVVLPKQSPVYLCGQKDGYITIVFPQNGSPADCSIRETTPCMSGIVPTPFETITLG